MDKSNIIKEDLEIKEYAKNTKLCEVAVVGDSSDENSVESSHNMTIKTPYTHFIDSECYQDISQTMKSQINFKSTRRKTKRVQKLIETIPGVFTEYSAKIITDESLTKNDIRLFESVFYALFRRFDESQIIQLMHITGKFLWMLVDLNYYDFHPCHYFQFILVHIKDRVDETEGIITEKSVIKKLYKYTQCVVDEKTDFDLLTDEFFNAFNMSNKCPDFPYRFPCKCSELSHFLKHRRILDKKLNIFEYLTLANFFCKIFIEIIMNPKNEILYVQHCMPELDFLKNCSFKSTEIIFSSQYYFEINFCILDQFNEKKHFFVLVIRVTQDNIHQIISFYQK